MLSCFRNTVESNRVDTTISTESNRVDTNLLSIKFSGATTSYKTKQVTRWLNCTFCINTELGTIDGYGLSSYGRKRTSFIMLGYVTKVEKNGDKWFNFHKIHCGLNAIEYKGFHKAGSDKISLVSQIASGELIIK